MCRWGGVKPGHWLGWFRLGAAGYVWRGQLCRGSALRVCRGPQPTRGSAGFRVEPRDGAEDVPFLVAAGYTRTVPVAKPKLGTLLLVIDTVMDADRTVPVKQRHTAKRIFERLRDEHDFTGYTVVKDYVRIGRARCRETFVPLSHPPGYAPGHTRWISARLWA